MKLTKQVVLKAVMGMLAVSVLGQGLNAKIIANYSDESFYEPDQGQIREYVIESAGYFLKAHSDYLLFLHKIEMAELQSPDFAELRHIIDEAAANMGRAEATYAMLAQLAAGTACKPEIKTALKEFDFTTLANFKGTTRMNGFGTTEAGGVVSARIRHHLETADVPSLYRELLMDTQQLHEMLNQLKAAVNADRLPRNQQLWQLYRSFSQTQLYGQYTAEIFSEITGK